MNHRGSNCSHCSTVKNHIAWVVGRPALQVVRRQVYDVVLVVDNNNCIPCNKETNHIAAWAVCRQASVVYRPASQVVPACVWDNSCTCSRR